MIGMGMFGGLLMILFLGVILVMAVGGISLQGRSEDRHSGYSRGENSAGEILDRRYARGEISADEYHAIKKDVME